MTKLTGALMLGVFLSLGAGGARGQMQAAGSGIAGTVHDFSKAGSVAQQQACIACHAPHESSELAPQWNPKLAQHSYSLYNLASAVTPVGQPGTYSKLCLSCHDGTLAILNYSGSKGSNSLLATRRLSSANSQTQFATRDHPIGGSYDTALAASDGSLADPQSSPVALVTDQVGRNRTRAGSISMMMLADGRVECTSCHDVHNRFNAGDSSRGLVKVGLAGSALCLVCHQK